MRTKLDWQLMLRKPTEAEIREYARQLYRKSGCVPGRDHENWLEAEAHLTALAARDASAVSGRRPEPATPLCATRAAALPLLLSYSGHRAVLRFLMPGDAKHLLEFFATHTADTIHQRYGFLLNMTPERAATLVGVDQTRDAALGLFETAGNGVHLVAIGRYCLAGDGRSAEVAFVVREDRRCLGIATALLQVLIGIGRERGLERFVAQLQHDNAPMSAVFRCAGATFHALPGGSDWLALMPLRRAAGAFAGSRGPQGKGSRPVGKPAPGTRTRGLPPNVKRRSTARPHST
jgi:GNAT superfamily N-acetyltransferase